MANRRLGHNIELARRRADLSRAGLAKQIHRKPAVVGSYERGEVEPPLSVLDAIADATDTPLIELLGIELSSSDLLRLLAERHEPINPCPTCNGDQAVQGIVVGVLIRDGNDAA